MRLLITFEPIDSAKYSEIDKYDIQGFIYYLLGKSSSFNELHELKGFKFFNFSNIFPVCDFERNSLKKLIISSPINDFIKTLYRILTGLDSFRLNKYKMELLKVKILKNKICSKFISSTPIVLYEDNQVNRYYSFNQSPNFNFFFNRLKDNAIKKYNAFYNTNFNLESDLFSGFELVKEVSIRLNKNKISFIIIGSIWKDLEFNLNNQNKDFYNFLFETGLGEKNSLGFGFLNCGK